MTVERISLGTFPGLVTRGDDDLPPVLGVHGAFGHAEQLTPLMTALAARGITMYALALKGHDRGTTSTPFGLGMRDYIDNVHAMIEHMPTPPILLGHSMGGLICEKVAEKTRVPGLILAAPAPAAPLMATARSLTTLMGMLPRILRGALLEPPRAAIADLAFTNSDRATREAVVAYMIPESGRAMRDMVLGAIKVDRAAIRCPVLALIGDRDYLVPPWQMHREARRLGANVIEYNGAGHFLIEDSWLDRIADDIATWIRTVVAPRVARLARTAIA